MPVMNGFEFLDAYQGLESAYQQSVVIVRLTTSFNQGDIERLQGAPIQGYLNKPLTEQMVLHLVSEHFGQ